MKKYLQLTFIILVLFCTDTYGQILSDSIELNFNDNEKLYNAFRNFNTIVLDTKKVREIFNEKKASTSFQIRVNANRTWYLVLVENEIRVPNYQISLDGEFIDTDFGECTTYKGYLEGSSDHVVRLSISDGIVEGYVMDGEDMMFIKPISQIIKNYSNREHFVVFNINDVIDIPSIESCGIGDVKAVKDAIQNNKNHESARATTSCRVLEIATEADFEFFQANGSMLQLLITTFLVF